MPTRETPKPGEFWWLLPPGGGPVTVLILEVVTGDQYAEPAVEVVPMRWGHANARPLDLRLESGDVGLRRPVRLVMEWHQPVAQRWLVNRLAGGFLTEDGHARVEAALRGETTQPVESGEVEPQSPTQARLAAAAPKLTHTDMP